MKKIKIHEWITLFLLASAILLDLTNVLTVFQTEIVYFCGSIWCLIMTIIFQPLEEEKKVIRIVVVIFMITGLLLCFL